MAQRLTTSGEQTQSEEAECMEFVVRPLYFRMKKKSFVTFDKRAS